MPRAVNGAAEATAPPRRSSAPAVDMLAHAIDYVQSGQPIFPVRRLDKSPYTPHGFEDATTDLGLIRAWWAEWPDAGIAMPVLPGRVVLDVDPRHGGDESLAALEAKYGPLPQTLECLTGGGGRHLHFALPDFACEVRSSHGKLGAGIDVKAEKSYTIAPPTLHKSGARYTWRDPSAAIAELPAWLANLLLEPTRPGSSGANGGAKIPEGQRNAYLTSRAGALRRKGEPEETILAALLAANQVRCDPPLPESEVRRIAKSVARYEPAEPQLKIGSTREDTSNSERFAQQHRDYVKFWHGRNKWLLWTGTHWADDQDAKVYELAKQTARAIYVEAAGLPEEEAKRMGRWAERSLNRDKIAAMLELAKSVPGIAITTDKVDCDPYAMNFTNGTVDLRTGKLREHRREDYLTKLVRWDYRADLVSLRWCWFLEKTFGIDLLDFVQAAVGYSLTGVTIEKIVFLLLGPTNAGKTTFLSTLRKIFPDYSAALQIETLMWGKNQDNNTSADLADLRGARFVVTSESEEGARLREAKLKRITQGMGSIKTARKYENPLEFPETHKLWIDANHAPIVRGSDDAIWKRLIPIRCNHRVADADIDKELPAKLLHEAEGIVAWAVAGAVRWHREGLGRPEIIEKARALWRESMDILGEFLAQCCVQNDGDGEAAQLYSRYAWWCEKNGHQPLSATAFGLRLFDRGFSKERRRQGGKQPWVYLALRLRDPFEPEGQQ